MTGLGFHLDPTDTIGAIPSQPALILGDGNYLYFAPGAEKALEQVYALGRELHRVQVALEEKVRADADAADRAGLGARRTARSPW